MEGEEGGGGGGGGSVGGGGKIKIGVCVMEKKVKCGSEVLFSFFICSVVVAAAAARICISRLLLLTNRFRCFFFKSPL